jgi:NUMOD4 motif/HNH endonuclease
MTEVTPETWLPVPDHEALYLASDDGQVRSLPRNTTSGRIMKLIPDKRGYLYVTLTKDGKQRKRPVHQVVMETFGKPCPPGMEIRHLDGNPANNRWAPGETEEEVRAAGGNLFYGTHAENMADMIGHGTKWQLNVTHCPKNHEYTPENTRITKTGSRACIECANEQAREWYRTHGSARKDSNVVCPVCERPFERRGRQKYCSQACVDEARRERRKAAA